MQNKLLEVKSLSVAFFVEEKEVNAIEDISFEILNGEVLGVVGESGCGKSVMATSIMQLFPRGSGKITDGQILLQGEDLLRLTETDMQKIRGEKISMIFQDPLAALNPVYTIGTQLVEMILLHQHISRSQAKRKAQEMLARVGISDPERRMKNYPHQISGGMRQRVMIAMALSASPQLLIADEPTTALDVTIQAQVLKLIDDLRREQDTSVLLITHDMGIIAERADRVMVMYAGQMVEYGRVQDIFLHPLHPYTEGLLKSIPGLYEEKEMLDAIGGTVPGLLDMPVGCRFSSRCPYCSEKCLEHGPDLFTAGDGRKVRCWMLAS